MPQDLEKHLLLNLCYNLLDAQVEKYPKYFTQTYNNNKKPFTRYISKITFKDTLQDIKVKYSKRPCT